MAGSKSDEFENKLLLLIFNNTTITTIGDAAGLLKSTGDGNLYVSLHTGNPQDTVTDPTSTETAYTNYVRQAVARSGAGWTVAANSVSPFANIDFPECGATPGAAITHFAVLAGIDATKDDRLVLYWGDLTPSITMATGVIPRIKTTSTITED